MAIDVGAAPPEPRPGQVGHFTHHSWLADAVETLASKAANTPAVVPEIDLSEPTLSVLTDITDALVAAGIVTKKA